MFKKHIFFFLFFLVCLTDLLAQSSGFKNYSIDVGLPSSQCYDIEQDNFGYIWISTENGISRFNGYEFENFEIQDGLTDNSVFNFHKQENGEIWCTTLNKKLFKISGQKPDFIPYKFNSVIQALPDLLELNVITNFYFTTDSSILLSFVNSIGYLQIDRFGKVIHNSVRTTIADFRCQTIIVNDKNSGYFFFPELQNFSESIKGIQSEFYSSKETNRGDAFIKAAYFDKFRTCVFTSPHQIIITNDKIGRRIISTEHHPIAVGAFDKNHFWVGFRFGGVRIYNLEGKLIESYIDKHSVNKLFVDHEGGIWLSTLDAGIFHSDNSLVKQINPADPNDNWINSLLYEKATNKIWVAYYNGNITNVRGDSMVHVYKSTFNKPAFLEMNKNLKQVFYVSDGIVVCNNDSKKSIKMGLTPTNLILYNDSIFLTAYRNIIMYSNGNTFHLSTGKRVNDICILNDTLYFASNNGLGIYRNEKTIFPYSDFPLLNLRIDDLEKRKNELLIATRGYGLVVKNGKRVYNISKKDGLESNSVFKIRIENDSVVWLCTNAGLSRVKFYKDTYSISNYSNKDGLLSNEVTDVLPLNDTVFVGTKRGLCYFTKSNLNKNESTVKNFLKIEHVLVNDKNINFKSGLNLEYNENRLEFNFIAFSFKNDHQVLYRYKLRGLEDDWNYTKSRNAIYPALPAGEYVFIVQVKSENGKWYEQQKKISISIALPFWKTKWFISSVSAAVLLLIYIFFRYNILSYNRDIIREMLRQLLKRIKKDQKYIVFREQGKDIKIDTAEILYVKSDGNYLEIITSSKKHLVRFKIGDFLKKVPDPLEFLRVNRSYIVRIDKIDEKSKKELTINGEKITVGETYVDQVQKIQF